VFKSLTWMRGIGATLFFFGGVIPLTWFIVSRIRSLKTPTDALVELDTPLEDNPIQSENHLQPEEEIVAV